MNELSALCKAAAITAVISGVITALLPKCKLTNAVNTLSVIIILYTFLTPLTDLNDDYEIFIINSVDTNTLTTEINVSDILIEMSENELKTTVEKILSENNIHANCIVELTYKDYEYINEKIILKGNFDTTEKELIKNIIETELERSVHIEFTD